MRTPLIIEEDKTYVLSVPTKVLNDFRALRDITGSFAHVGANVVVISDECNFVMVEQ